MDQKKKNILFICLLSILFMSIPSIYLYYRLAQDLYIKDIVSVTSFCPLAYWKSESEDSHSIVASAYYCIETKSSYSQVSEWYEAKDKWRCDGSCEYFDETTKFGFVKLTVWKRLTPPYPKGFYAEPLEICMIEEYVMSLSQESP